MEGVFFLMDLALELTTMSISLPPSVTLYLSRTKKQIKREENHLMEDKKKKKQEEKKKKDAPKKVRHMHVFYGWRKIKSFCYWFHYLSI